VLAIAVVVAAPAQVIALGARPANAAPAPIREEGVRWHSLTAAQREALAPLEHDWPTIEAQRKQKWIALAGRFKTLSPEERSRITARMTEWVRLTPAERGQARLRFEEARQVPATDRSARWQAYQALPPERREEFAARAASAASASSSAGAKAAKGFPRDSKEAKSNIVPNPALSQAPRPVDADPGPGRARRDDDADHAAADAARAPAERHAEDRDHARVRAALHLAAATRTAGGRDHSGDHASADGPGVAGNCGDAGRLRPGPVIAPASGAPRAPDASSATPSLARRMASFVYEAMLLFGLSLIPGVLGALFFAQTGQRHPLQSDTALRIYALALYGVYFVWFWSRRGQTLAMQTWRIRLVTAAGAPVSQTRALARYAACCIAWFGPPTALATALHWPPATSLAALALWFALYALLALRAPERQFWHDWTCGTRLVPAGDAPRVRPRPR
jgi:Predicted membrane protein/domain